MAGVVGAGDPEHLMALPCASTRSPGLSWRVLLRAWPMWRAPVTLGGGMTIEKRAGRDESASRL